MNFFYAFIGICILIVLGKLLSIPFKIMKKLVINGIVGFILLLITNIFAGGYISRIPVTPINSLIVGFFGIPGLIVLYFIGN